MNLERHFHLIGSPLVQVLASINQRSTEVFRSLFHTEKKHKIISSIMTVTNVT